MKSMLFHIPFKINPNHPSGTNIRPLKMLAAFKANGYEVDVVMGTAQERKTLAAVAKAKINSGHLYDFMYSESATLPTLLTEDHHLPTHPFVDFGLFKICKAYNIPIGLFYRDVYWNFDDYKLNGIKAKLTKSMYHLDLYLYGKYLKRMFLPSMEMKPYVPLKKDIPCYALPSGMADKTNTIPTVKTPIRYFYVGGISDMYSMHELFKAFQQYPNAQLVFCTRASEWEAKRSEYEQYLSANIEIHHLSGEAMESLMQTCSVGLLFFKPNTYREFAMPVKLFDYMSSTFPIISSQGTATGNFIEKHQIGWSIDYNNKALLSMLEKLDKQASLLTEKQERIIAIKNEQTWQHRAKEVAHELMQKKGTSK